MSGLAMIIGDNSYAGANVGYSLPVSRGARSLFFPKGDAAQTIANKVDSLAGGVGNAAMQGAPTFNAGYASLHSGTDYIQTASPDAPTSTILCVARTSDSGTLGTTTPALGGNMTLSASGYAMFLADNAGVLNFTARRVTVVSGSPANSAVIRTPASINMWAFFAAVFENGVGITVYNKTMGGPPQFLSLPTLHVAGASGVRAGSVNGTSYTGRLDLAFWAEHNVALTSLEIDSIYQSVKNKIASYAIPITI